MLVVRVFSHPSRTIKSDGSRTGQANDPSGTRGPCPTLVLVSKMLTHVQDNPKCSTFGSIPDRLCKDKWFWLLPSVFSLFSPALSLAPVFGCSIVKTWHMLSEIHDKGCHNCSS